MKRLVILFAIVIVFGLVIIAALMGTAYTIRANYPTPESAACLANTAEVRVYFENVAGLAAYVETDPQALSFFFHSATAGRVLVARRGALDCPLSFPCDSPP